ncbi:MAG: hypothetical protein ACO1SV_14775 [Fimbriimonas sp.]
MKRRGPLFLAVALGAVALAVAWGVRPEESGIPPEIARELTFRNAMPGAGFGGSPPSGTLWETYVVPLPYARVTDAMGADRRWRGERGVQFSGVPRVSFRPVEANPQARVDVLPGRLFIIDRKGAASDRGHPEDYSVVLVATPFEPTLRKKVLGWVDRLLGQKPPTLAPGTFVAYQYPKEYLPAPRRRTPAQGKRP